MSKSGSAAYSLLIPLTTMLVYSKRQDQYSNMTYDICTVYVVTHWVAI